MATGQQKILLDKLIQQLTALGEDKAELEIWKQFFDLMNGEEQQKLLENLRSELKKLQQLNPKP